ncbi:uncharacterized protein LOC124467093 isoform X2 [Hypomesus transpacificus]|uniref:uncharacterized protein LOC124467093 isoform X2 n=1 Tax=Hypomesus transpacificus TaxID=137520 RepID=UPI001F07144A|nr:uncharacterized protein LOC124467093 isoform X2 [Hypomesus transpacificus]
MTTYFCLLVSVLVCKNYAEMTCQSVQQKTNVTLSCGHSEGDVTWSRDQDGGKVNISDPGKRFSSGLGSLTILRVISSDSGVYYCNDEPVVNLTVTPDVPMTPHTIKNPTTRVKNTVTTRTVSVAEAKKFNINDEKKHNKKNKKKNKKDGKKKEDKKGKKEKKDDKTEEEDDDNDDDDKDGEDVTMTPHTTKNPTTRVKNKDVTTTPHTTKNPTTRVKNTVTTWTVSVAKESEATKKDENKDTKSEKNKSLWQLPLGVAAGGLVLVLVLLLVGFLIRRCWARKSEGDRDRPPAVYAEITDMTQQPKDGSCSPRSKEHSVYYLAGAPGTQEEVHGMNPIYHTIQDPNITTNLSNAENPDFLAQNPEVP